MTLRQRQVLALDVAELTQRIAELDDAHIPSVGIVEHADPSRRIGGVRSRGREQHEACQQTGNRSDHELRFLLLLPAYPMQ